MKTNAQSITAVIHSILCLLFLSTGIVWAYEDRIDIDADGTPDTVFIKKNGLDISDGSDISGDDFLVELKIIFSSGAKSIYLNKWLDFQQASDFTTFLWRNTPGILVLNYSQLSTRQPTDFNYEIYSWVRRFNKLCLHSATNGIPGDKALGEYAYERHVRLYSDCVGLEEEIPNGYVNDEDYYRKSLVYTFISAKQARLYNSPNDNDKSKMYLIKGDKVKVKDYKYKKNTGTDWFFVEYQSEKKTEPISKWVRGESVEPYVR